MSTVQEVFWNALPGRWRTAWQKFESTRADGKFFEAHVALASNLYGMRVGVQYPMCMWLAKRHARIAQAFVQVGGQALTPNTADVLSRILIAGWPVLRRDAKVSKEFAQKGSELLSDFPETRPHVDAHLHLTLAFHALREHDRDPVVLMFVRKVELRLRQIGVGDIAPDARLHEERQKTRVLKDLARVYSKLGKHERVAEYLNDAEKLARQVSRDQLRKIRLIQAELWLRRTFRL